MNSKTGSVGCFGLEANMDHSRELWMVLDGAAGDRMYPLHPTLFHVYLTMYTIYQYLCVINK